VLQSVDFKEDKEKQLNCIVWFSLFLFLTCVYLDNILIDVKARVVLFKHKILKYHISKNSNMVTKLNK